MLFRYGVKMKLIVGLGNPDKEYNNTFHNLGFAAVDKAAEKLGASFSSEKCKARIAEARVGSEKVLIAKPLTYMNLSGESVRTLCSYYKISGKDLLVLYDDYDLKKGNVRIRESGSAGTHNGMRNIVKELGTENFMRIRIGFHPEGDDVMIPLINLVLSGIKEADKPLFDKALDAAANAAVAFAKNVSSQEIMQKYNGKPQ